MAVTFLPDVPDLSQKFTKTLVFPCELELQGDKFSNRPLLLFDLPEDVFVDVNDRLLPSDTFDYFNPLLMTDSYVPIIVDQLGEPLSIIKCWIILSPCVDLLNSLTSIYYHTKNLTIEYSKEEVFPLHGNQIRELLAQNSSVEQSSISNQTVHISNIERILFSHNLPPIMEDLSGIIGQLVIRDSILRSDSDSDDPPDMEEVN